MSNYNRGVKVLFLCGRELEYARNQVLYRAFKTFSDVDLVAETGGGKSLMLRSMRVALRALPKYLIHRYDLIFIGFYGYLLLPFSHPRKGAPLLFDAFVSNFNTLIEDRKVAAQGSLVAKLAQALDSYGLNAADYILLDTQSHADYFSRRIGLSPERIKIVPVGSVDSIFAPSVASGSRERLKVVYYCTYLPLHGVSTVIRAASILKDAPVDFELIGTGMEYDKTRELSESLGLTNISFSPPVPLAELMNRVKGSDICLGGHFGTSAKADMTIPGKIYQQMAAGKPIIAGNTHANREILIHRENALLCQPDDPEALAAQLKSLIENAELRTQLGIEARKTYERYFSEEKIAEKFKDMVLSLVNDYKSRSN